MDMADKSLRKVRDGWPNNSSKPLFLFTRLQYFTLVAAFLTTVVWMFFMGYRAGQNVAEREGAIYNFPKCEEDEWLYPRDYKGPGKNLPADYECHHFDELVDITVEGVMEQLGWDKP